MTNFIIFFSVIPQRHSWSISGSIIPDRPAPFAVFRTLLGFNFWSVACSPQEIMAQGQEDSKNLATRFHRRFILFCPLLCVMSADGKRQTADRIKHCTMTSKFTKSGGLCRGVGGFYLSFRMNLLWNNQEVTYFSDSLLYSCQTSFPLHFSH